MAIVSQQSCRCRYNANYVLLMGISHTDLLYVTLYIITPESDTNMSIGINRRIILKVRRESRHQMMMLSSKQKLISSVIVWII